MELIVGWQPGKDSGTGDTPGPGLPDGQEAPNAPAFSAGPVRDPRLQGFVKDGEWDTSQPSAELAVAMEAVSGTEWRCPVLSGGALARPARRCSACCA